MSHQSTGWEPPTTVFIKQPTPQVEPPVVTLVGVFKGLPFHAAELLGPLYLYSGPT